MRILLDSNAYSHLKRGHPRAAEIVRASEEVLLSTVVIGELLYGFRRGSRLDRNLRELQAFIDSPYVTVAPVSYTTADRYARIAAKLRARGRPIPSNDIWIAAHALETGADLLSADRHFADVDGVAWMPLDGLVP
ncbi:MAG: type II toxin-antitoxin system VapC family toxin [Acidobacteria bacterium]|nr:type II toxin-antitoxin system VapC family toxin [Acidobacteriota bacterium]MYJ02860.1 type II toxin-antitoxin system VapC family toxin [Acidobacteriota bacterium]